GHDIEEEEADYKPAYDPRGVDKTKEPKDYPPLELVHSYEPFESWALIRGASDDDDATKGQDGK
ncbi:hypothetical protein HAX54_037753, partial [Datura stramonium]|nr:hypothetical protein [Datura stramonium]